MKNYKMVICYDGTRYDGWQKQGNTNNTIQGKLEKILEKMLGYRVELQGSGRTDAGVHAFKQIANVKCTTGLSADEMLCNINQFLPGDIAVLSVEEVKERFHSRLNVKEKIYQYRINNSSISNVFERKYVYQFPDKLDIDKMKMAAEYMIGEYDCKSFCSSKKIKKSTIRDVRSIDIIKEGNEVKILFRGNGFLYHMVRIMTGTLLEVGTGKIKPEEIISIIGQKDRQAAGITAPACGLALMEVRYYM